MILSVIMSVYNESPDWIKKSVNSILTQTFRDYEFLIICDNPENKDLINMLSDFSKRDKRIKLIKNEENIGLARSLNKGLKIASGRFIARMDADDISMQNRFEKQLMFLKNNKDIGLVGSAIELIDDNENSLGFSAAISDMDIIKRIIKYRSVSNHPTWMFRAKILDILKGYRSFMTSQDYDFLYRALDHGIKISNINEALLKYRMHNNNITQKHSFIQHQIRRYIISLHKERKKNKLYKDSFSVTNQDRIINKNNNHFLFSISQFLYIIALKNRGTIYSYFLLILSSSISITQFKNIIGILISKIIIKNNS